MSTHSNQIVSPGLSGSYERKMMSVKQAMRSIRRGGRIFLGSGCGEPLTLSQGLIEHASHFADNPIIHILSQGDASYTKSEFANSFRLNAFFIGSNVRQAVQEGRADYTPIFLSEVPALFASGQMPLEAALIQVSPPDAQGYCSLGTNIDIVKAAAQQARLVIAQVNTCMPRTFGDSFIHLNDIDTIIESDVALPEYRPLEDEEGHEAAHLIGLNVARLVKDGATLQLGIGAIPNPVLACLKDKNDLGIHTEMLSDGVMELVQHGNITGRKKTLHPNAIVTSFCMGTRALYDFVDRNPHVLFFPSDYTNDPGIIRQNDHMVAVNSAIAIDLTGQVCADSVGTKFYSGIGGQMDFMRGAARSRGGRPIIALPSTARSPLDGRLVSRIVLTLAEGAGVVTSRGDVHYVVTEYGIAYLHGKTVAERARALIEIAHPDFRNELLEAAKTRHYAHRDLGRFPKRDPYPAQYEHRQTFQHPQQGEVEIFFRPIRPVDERRLQEFFYSHTEETVYGRYGYRACSMSHKRALSLVQLNYQTRFALVGLIGEPGHERIVAVGRYEVNEDTHLADIALVVQEDYRRMGIATHLVECLVQVIREKGFTGITGHVSGYNKHVRQVLERVLGQPNSETTRSGATYLGYTLTAPSTHQSNSDSASTTVSTPLQLVH